MNTFYKNIIACLFLMFFTTVAIQAQQAPVFSLYADNPYLLNPSAAGQKGSLNGAMLVRRQWANIEGAPQTQLISLDGNTGNKRVGLGMQISNDVNNIIGHTTAMGTYAYHLPINSVQQISFGLSAGIRNTRLNFDRIVADDAYEEVLLSQGKNTTSFDAEFGFIYQYKRFRAGMTSHQLFANNLKFSEESAFKNINYKLIRHYSGSLNYVIPVPQQKLEIEPSVVFRSVQGMPFQFDMGTVFRYRKDYWLAPAYRTGSGLSMAAGLKITENISLAYAHEFNQGNMARLGGGTDEIMLSFNLNGRKASENMENRTADNGDKLGKIEQQLVQQYEVIDQLSEQNEKLQDEVAKSRILIDRQQQEIDRLKKVAVMDADGLHELKKKLEEIGDEEDLDLEKNQYYVIVSAFKTLENAKAQQRIFSREASLSTNIVLSKNQSYYLIYTKKIEKVQDALEEAAKLKKSEYSRLIVGNPWVYIEEK